MSAHVIGQSIARSFQGARSLTWSTPDGWHRLAALSAMLLLSGQTLSDGMLFAAPNDATRSESGSGGVVAVPGGSGTDTRGDALFGGYVGIPWHHRSDIHMTRPDGTDVTLKKLRWDGEPFNFPLYAGVRGVRWSGPFGGMIDFLHDKAIARTGKGAHGRKVTGERAIPDVVEAEGLLKGQPVTSPIKLTDVLERLEFSHGHNLLLPTALLRFGGIATRWRPYVGLGAGVALPHVEVWPKGEGEEPKTNEYQAAGPAMQVVAGIELQGARGSYFVEYKFTYASLSTALTGGKTPSWCNCDIVSDFARHIMNWWSGTEPRYGHLDTTIAAHQIVGGAGYRPGSSVVPTPAQ